MINTIVKKTYVNEEGFNFTLEPIESSLEIKKTKTGYTAKYLSQDNNPIDPREDDNLGTMVCFHNRYTLGDKTDLNPNNYTSWQELKDHLIKVEKAVVILPLYLYDHSGISIRTVIHGQHSAWDGGWIGFIYVSKDKLKKERMTAKQAEKTLQAEVETYNQYLTGEVYSLVKEIYDKKKTQIDYDTVGGYSGEDYALKALETEI